MPDGHLLLEYMDRQRDLWLKISSELAGGRAFAGILRFGMLEPNVLNQLKYGRPRANPYSVNFSRKPLT